jgi:hypothetical protein
LLGYARVWRDDDRSITFAFPRRWLGSDVDGYSWSVLSDSNQEGCQEQSGDTFQEFCFDQSAGRHEF